MRNPITNEMERQEMFALLRRRVRKESGTAHHFNNPVTEEDILFWAIEETYFYIFNKKDIPVSASPDYMLSCIIKEAGEDNVKVLEKSGNAIKIKLKKHVWWLCRGLFSACESRMPWLVSHIGVNGNASPTCPGPVFPVSTGFEKVIPILDELFPQIKQVAFDAVREKVKEFSSETVDIQKQ